MSRLRLRFGTFLHEDAEAAVEISRDAQRTDSGQIYGILETWAIRGRLEADDQATLTTKILQLEAAYKLQVDEMSLEFADTGLDTAHSIKASNLLSPIEVIVPPSYPIGEGAQYAGFRDYQIVVQAIVDTGQLPGGLVQWEETIEVSGGWPKDVLVHTLNTLPIRQRAAQATATIVRQYGSATSMIGWPMRPGFMFNIETEAVLMDYSYQKRGERVSLIGGSKKGQYFSASWSYTYGLSVLPGFEARGPRRPLSLPVTQY